jgi:hypothetical protein
MLGKYLRVPLTGRAPSKITLPKVTGGLGIGRLDQMNKV